MAANLAFWLFFIFFTISNGNCSKEFNLHSLTRNGIFITPSHSLAVVSSTQSFNATNDSDSPIGLLSSTRVRVKRLVVIPKDDLELPGQTCTDDYCLEEGYDRLERPLPLEGGPIRVDLEMENIRIIEVDDETFSVSVQMNLGVRWKEPRIHAESPQSLRFDYTNEDADYEYDTFASVDSKFVRHLWVPDLYVYHMKYGSRTLKDFDGRLLLLNDNEIFYRQELIVSVWCPLRFEFYPMDHQVCDFRLGSYSLGPQEMVVTLVSLELDKATPNPVLEYVQMDPFPQGYTNVKNRLNTSVAGFRMRLKRRSFQYFVNFYLPSSLFVVVSWTSFLIPPDLIPGRMTLLVTLFLVLVNIFLTVNRKSPKVEGITSLAAFVIVCILFVFGALFAYALILSKKKTDGVKNGDWRNGSLTIAHLFPLPQLVSSSKSAWSSSTRSPDTLSDESAESHGHNQPLDEDNLPEIPTAPPLPPKQKQRADSLYNCDPDDVIGNGTISQRVSVAEPIPGPRNSISLLTAGILMARKDSCYGGGERGGWHDEQMHSVDGVLVILFPMCFLAFNCIYWPFLIYYQELYPPQPHQQ